MLALEPCGLSRLLTLLNNVKAVLVVLVLCDPELVECTERREDASA